MTTLTAQDVERLAALAEEGGWWRLVFDPDNGEEQRLFQGAELDAAINEFIAAKAR
jgi:hypothetical protein